MGHTDLKLYFCDNAVDVIRTRANFYASKKAKKAWCSWNPDALPTELATAYIERMIFMNS